MWATAQNFADLLDLNRQYNRGRDNDGKNIDYREWIDPCVKPLDAKPETRERIDKLGVFVYSAGEYIYDKVRGRALEQCCRPYISFWCPGRTEPLKLILELRKRAEIIVYAAKLFPFQVVEGTPAKPTYVYKSRSAPEKDYEYEKRIEAFDISKGKQFWELDNVRREEPWLIDVVTKSWDDLDLVGVIKDIIDECEWSNA